MLPAGVLRVQEFLRSGGTPEQLTAQYAIKVKPHRQWPELLGLYYNQVHSPMHLRLVQECRGLILNSADDWNVVACPFFKFFNLGEPNAAKMDWSTAQFQHKLDGSLMTLYYYKGWQVASNGTPDASGEVSGKRGTRFSDLFWEVWKALGYTLPRPEPTCSYMFELMTPYNRVVVRHSENMLALIGCRDNHTLQEFATENVRLRTNWRVVNFHNVSLDVAQQAVAGMNGLEQEGFVAVDAQFNRVKIKSPDYLRLHRMVDNVSEKSMLDIIRQGEASEVLTYFPEHKRLHDDVAAKMNAFACDMQKLFESIRHIEDRKSYALAVQALKTKCPDVLFKMHQGAIKDMATYFSEIPLKRLAAMVLE